jgi:hypothetical protein
MMATVSSSGRGPQRTALSRYGEGDILAVPRDETGRHPSIRRFTIVTLRDGAGALTGLAAIMRDVTERFEEMRALKQKLAEATKAPSGSKTERMDQRSQQSDIGARKKKGPFWGPFRHHRP